MKRATLAALLDQYYDEHHDRGSMSVLSKMGHGDSGVASSTPARLHAVVQVGVVLGKMKKAEQDALRLRWIFARMATWWRNVYMARGSRRPEPMTINLSIEEISEIADYYHGECRRIARRAIVRQAWDRFAALYERAALQRPVGLASEGNE